MPRIALTRQFRYTAPDGTPVEALQWLGFRHKNTDLGKISQFCKLRALPTAATISAKDNSLKIENPFRTFLLAPGDWLVKPKDKIIEKWSPRKGSKLKPWN